VENVKLFMAADPNAPFDAAEHAFDFRRAKNLKMKDVSVVWEKPALKEWRSAAYFEDVRGLELDGFAARGADDAPAVVLNNVAEATVRHSKAFDGTATFLNVMGKESRDIRVEENDLRKAKVALQMDVSVQTGTVEVSKNDLAKP